MQSQCFSSVREQVVRNGYATFAQVLTPEEVERIRTAVVNFFEQSGIPRFFGKTQPDAFSRIPEIRWLITHPKILAAVCQCAGRDDIQFTFHSDCHMNMLSGWHTDTEAYFTSEESAPEDFQVFKVGIYLQDHLHDNQGLTVSEGSHLPPNRLLRDRIKALNTRAGDIIVFDVRLWHAGDQTNFLEKVFNKLAPNEDIKYRAGLLFRLLSGRKQKVSVFFTYGAPNQYTLEFSRRNMIRQNKQNGIDYSHPPAEDLVQLLHRKRVDMVNLVDAL